MTHPTTAFCPETCRRVAEFTRGRLRTSSWPSLTIPTYDRFIEPILRYLAKHPEGALARDAHEAAANALRLDAYQRAQVLPSGKQAIYKNRAGWAHDRLKRAGLSESTRRGLWALTDRGRAYVRSMRRRSPTTRWRRSPPETRTSF